MALMRCADCYSSDFRLSRFRLHDLPHLFIFQYPIRCRICNMRGYASLNHVFGLPKRHHTAAADPKKV